MKTIDKILLASWPAKFAVLVSADLLVLFIAALFAVTIRFDSLEIGLANQGSVIALGPPITIIVFWMLGIYRIVIRYAGPSMVPRLALASVIVAILLAGGSFLLDREGGQSRAVFVLFGMLSFLACWTLPRLLWRPAEIGL